ncbi:hypothetical protein VNO78_26777 [Psophocarpus tetragonolobus]|uniref:Homeobox-leucine zipper protein n=1 Tax=Psophocarpus tetragonolobus TaxID=3891 RepID=A0AAN9X9F2_PSOTE
MDWHQSAKPFLPLPEPSLSFFYNYNNHPYPAQTQTELMETGEWLVPAMDDYRNKNKKRLKRDQIEVLEMSFVEKMKLDPERKKQLSRELGLEPRQVAVWFQNRRTRWKTKQIEHSYCSLKHQYDVILKENQKLQEEVMKLKAMLSLELGFEMHLLGGYTEIGGEEIVEQVVDQSFCSVTEEDCNTVSLPHCHWSVAPY